VTATVARVERPEDLEAAFALRFAVFVEEQGVAPELELDALETSSTHLVAREDGGGRHAALARGDARRR